MATIMRHGLLFRAALPYSQAGVFIEKTATYIKVKAKLGLFAIWNEEDSFLVGTYIHVLFAHIYVFLCVYNILYMLFCPLRWSLTQSTRTKPVVFVETLMASGSATSSIVMVHSDPP